MRFHLSLLFFTNKYQNAFEKSVHRIKVKHQIDQANTIRKYLFFTFEFLLFTYTHTDCYSKIKI